MPEQLRWLSEEDARRRLRALAAEAGGYSALARRLGCSVQYLHRGATTHRPTGLLLRALRLEQRLVMVYVPTAQPDSAEQDAVHNEDFLP